MSSILFCRCLNVLTFYHVGQAIRYVRCVATTKRHDDIKQRHFNDLHLIVPHYTVIAILAKFMSLAALKICTKTFRVQ